MKKNRVRALTEGAVCAALTVLLMVISIYVPLFGIFSVVIVGLPTVFMAVRHGLRFAGVSAAAAVLVMMILMGDIVSALMMALLHLLPAAAIGFTLNRRKPFLITVLAAAGAVLVGLLAELLLLNAAGGGNGINNLLDTNVEAMRQTMTQIMGNLSAGEAEQLGVTANALNQAFGLVKEMILLYLPTLTIAIACGLGYGAVAMSIFMLRRMRLLKVPYIPFWMIRAPRSMCYLSMILQLFTYGAQEITVFTAGMQNMALLLDCFIGVCGLSLIDYKLSEKVSSGYARAGIYLAVLVVGYVGIGIIARVLVFLGLLDSLFGFRRFYKVGEGHGENK